MQISIQGTKLIAEFEGFSNKPYLDQRDIPTIGYGSTIYPNGEKVKLTDTPITKEFAIECLLYHVGQIVIPIMKKKIIIELNQNQIDSLASFIYNVGIGAFGNSTLLRRINNKFSKEQIKEAFLMWNKISGNTSKGLTNRREKEANLFNK